MEYEYCKFVITISTAACVSFDKIATTITIINKIDSNNNQIIILLYYVIIINIIVHRIVHKLIGHLRG